MTSKKLSQILDRAKTLSARVDRQELVDLYKEAFSINPSSYDIKKKLADALRNLGHGKYFERKYEEARRAFIEAADLYSQLNEVAEEYKVVKSKGRCEGHLGDLDSCIETFKNLLTNFRKDKNYLDRLSDGGIRDISQEAGKITFYLSIAYFKKGLWREALKTVRLAQKMLAGSDYVGLCVQGEGIALTELGEFEKAIEILKQAKKYFKDSEYKRANIDENISLCLHRLGRDQEAIELLDNSIRIYEEEGISRPWGYFHRGVSYESLGQVGPAGDDYARAIEIIETTRAELSLDIFRRTYITQNLIIYDYAILNAISQGKISYAYDLIQRAKGRGFGEKLESTFSIINGRYDKDWEQLRVLRDKIDKLFAEFDNLDLTCAVEMSELKKLESEYARLLRKIKENDTENAALVLSASMPLSDIQEIIDAGTAIIDYYVTSEKLIIFIITKNDVDSVVVSAESDVVLKAAECIKLWINGIEKAALSEVSDLKKEGLEWYLSSISKLLFLPAEKFLKDIQRLIFIPHLSLHYIPFALLKTADGKKIIESYEITNIPSPRLLKRIKENKSVVPTSALIVANPSGDLPFSDEEARVIVEIVPSAMVLSGSDAKKDEILKLMRGGGRFQALHFSCHCKINPDAHDFTGLIVAGKKGKEIARIELNEIIEIQHQANIVVLSGCETGIGDAPPGDEITSLPRAFIYGGANTVVVTLWEIDDRSTAEFMRYFYQGIYLDKLSPSAALKNAQLKMIDRYNPYHWAGFQNIGY